MKIILIHRHTIEDFKSQWPCHVISDDVDFICAVFDDNGNLLDYEFEDAKGETLFIGDIPYDSVALGYLMSDAWNHHTEKLIPGTIGPILTANPSYPLVSAEYLFADDIQQNQKINSLLFKQF